MKNVRYSGTIKRSVLKKMSMVYKAECAWCDRTLMYVYKDFGMIAGKCKHCKKSTLLIFDRGEAYRIIEDMN